MTKIFAKHGLSFYINEDDTEITIKENGKEIFSISAFEGQGTGYLNYFLPTDKESCNETINIINGGLYTHKKVENRFCFAVNKLNAKNKLGAMKSNVKCLITPEEIKGKEIDTIDKLKELLIDRGLMTKGLNKYLDSFF